MSSILKQKTQSENRLSKLYDLRVDGDIDNDVFRFKEIEYKNQLIDIESTIEQRERSIRVISKMVVKSSNFQTVYSLYICVLIQKIRPEYYD